MSSIYLDTCFNEFQVLLLQFAKTKICGGMEIYRLYKAGGGGGGGGGLAEKVQKFFRKLISIFRATKLYVKCYL